MVVTADNERRHLTSARSLKAVIDFAVGSHVRAVALLLLVALLSFLPGFFSIPPIDRDEARFAQATKQMVESGDYIDIRFQDEVRYKKPVGIYWLQSGVVKAARALGFEQALTTIWLYRMPSLLGAIGAVLLTYWAALAFVSRRAALLAGLMMASCVLLGIERLIAKTDAMLLLTVVAAMGAMARAYLPDLRERLEPAAAWTVGGGILERARRRRAAQGAAHRNDCRTGRWRADRRRSLCPLAAGAQAAGRNRLARAAGAALVHRDRRTRGRCVLRRVGRTRLAQQGFCRPGVLMARRPGRISCCSG